MQIEIILYYGLPYRGMIFYLEVTDFASGCMMNFHRLAASSCKAQIQFLILCGVLHGWNLIRKLTSRGANVLAQTLLWTGSFRLSKNHRSKTLHVLCLSDGADSSGF